MSYLGILIKNMGGNHIEDIILKNHKPKKFRKYSKTSIEVQLEEAAW